MTKTSSTIDDPPYLAALSFGTQEHTVSSTGNSGRVQEIPVYNVLLHRLKAVSGDWVCSKEIPCLGTLHIVRRWRLSILVD